MWIRSWGIVGTRLGTDGNQSGHGRNVNWVIVEAELWLSQAKAKAQLGMSWGKVGSYYFARLKIIK